MYYSVIKNFDIANGEGCRVTLFVSGCRNHCKGCFQPETWDFKYGKKYTQETEDKLIEMLSNEHIAGLTLLGGDPFEPENQPDLARLTTRLRKEMPNKNVWAYTGCVLDDLKAGKNKTDYTNELINNIDILVDGPFILEQRSLCLRFKGSANQRLIKNPGYEKYEVIG